MTTSQPPGGRYAQGRFTAGNKGRPFGSRNRVSKRVARAILADFEAHQDDILPKLRRWYAPQYVSLVARLLPRVNESGADVELDALDEAETQGIAAALRAALERLEAGAGSVAELEAALLGEQRGGVRGRYQRRFTVNGRRGPRAPLAGRWPASPPMGGEKPGWGLRPLRQSAPRTATSPVVCATGEERIRGSLLGLEPLKSDGRHGQSARFPCSAGPLRAGGAAGVGAGWVFWGRGMRSCRRRRC